MKVKKVMLGVVGLAVAAFFAYPVFAEELPATPVDDTVVTEDFTTPSAEDLVVVPTVDVTCPDYLEWPEGGAHPKDIIGCDRPDDGHTSAEELAAEITEDASETLTMKERYQKVADIFAAASAYVTEAVKSIGADDETAAEVIDEDATAAIEPPVASDTE